MCVCVCVCGVCVYVCRCGVMKIAIQQMLSFKFPLVVTLVTTLNGARSVAPGGVRVTFTKKYSPPLGMEVWLGFLGN